MAVDEHRKTELARQDHRLRLPVEQQNHRAVAAIVGLTALSLPNAVAPQKIKGGFFSRYQSSDNTRVSTMRTLSLVAIIGLLRQRKEIDNIVQFRVLSRYFVQSKFERKMAMLTSQRKKIILEKLAEDGQVLAKQLSEMFGLSEDTVRRDLRELDAEGLLQRVHGGALPVSSAIASFAERNQLESGAKRAIAKAAAALIAPAR